MVNGNSKDRPVWQLLVLKIAPDGHAITHKNARYHCFVDNSSLCGMHNQQTENYVDDDIAVDSGTILQLPHFGCQKCYRRWRREYMVE